MQEVAGLPLTVSFGEIGPISVVSDQLLPG